MTTPHPSAVRAADEILANYGIIQLKAARDANAITCAHIIDRETGVGELEKDRQRFYFLLDRLLHTKWADAGNAILDLRKSDCGEKYINTPDLIAGIDEALTRHQQRSQPKP